MIHHLLAPRNDQLLLIIQSETNLSSEVCQWLLDLGSIYHNHSRALTNLEVKTGDYIRVHSNPRRFHVNLNWKSKIIFENDDFVVINKPFGVPTHPTVDNKIENAAHQMSMTLEQPIFVTHRLDVATSGLLCLAKTKNFQSRFNRHLQEKLIEKKYRARVEGHLKIKGIIQHYMEDNVYLPKKVSETQSPGSLECLLEIEQYSHEHQSDGSPYSVVDIRLITGRTHQIRSQLASIGHPILGDKIYGGKEPWDKIEAIELISRHLKFNFDQEYKFNL
jgi:23S rRNA pseudouridine1911/1915/1917 synthase